MAGSADRPSGFSFTYLAPRYWTTLVGLGLLRVCTWLPFKAQLFLGSSLGQVMYRLIKRRRLVAEVNICRCFPQLSEAAQQNLVKQCFESVGISIFEIGLSWWGTRGRLERLCHIEGMQHLTDALAKGRGALLMSAHFTCLEIGGRLLSFHHPFAVMYKSHRNPLFEVVMNTARRNHYQAAIKQDDIRGLLRLLKSNHPVWYAPDQDLGAQRSVFAPFMGVPAATITAPAKIIRLSSAAVVPFFALRRKDGKGYDLRIYPALENYPSDDEIENATRINQLIEEQIQIAPDQYLWLHRRFKTKPPTHHGNN